ncbi:MAG: TIGR03089 family protein [Micromonosporaceae bacterium]
MSGFIATTIDALWRAAVPDPTRPVITYYDDATGERTELSGATLDNWVAKTANLLVDGLALGPGDTAAVLLPPHWQTAAVLLGCWAAGVTVRGAVPDGPDRQDGQVAHVAQVAFATADRLDAVHAATPDVYVLGLAPLAAPMRPGPPPGAADYIVEVRAYGDHFSATAGAADLATPTATHEDLCGRAGQRSAELGIAAGSRVLVDGDAVTDPVDWLLAPLAAGASIVLCRHVDPRGLDERAATERVTVRLPS